MSAVDTFVRCALKAAGGRYCTPPNEPRCTDCSGLIRRCFKEAAGKDISGSSYEQAKMGKPVKEPRAGDILVYGGGSHVGIVVGENRAVHALNPDLGIKETRIEGANLGLSYSGARRLDFSQGADPADGPPAKSPASVQPATPRAGADLAGSAALSGAAVTPQTPFRLTGNTTRQAFAAALGRTVGGLSPPLAEADAIYDALAVHKLTRLAAVMAWIERKNDTHEPSYAYYGPELHNLWAVKNRDGSWMEFPSYFEAAGHWTQYILGQTYRDLTTLREFINRYAPPSENDTDRYVRQLVDGINALPLLAESPEPPMPEPQPIPWSPVIYDLANDAHARRFGLAPAERDVITSRGAPRSASSIQAIQLHVQWGNTPGSLRHWLGVSASSTVMVQRDGSILRVIPELQVPWTGGDVKSPDAEARALMQRFGPDPNQYSLTIEAEDERTEDVTPTQERTVVWQIREWQRTYPHAPLIAPERILGHYQINAVDRARCGRYTGRIEQQLAANAPAPPPLPTFPGLPAWLPEDALRAAFPLADPSGEVTKAVIAWATETGRVPWFVGKTDLGNGRNLWRFDDVTFLSDKATVWREGSAA